MSDKWGNNFKDWQRWLNNQVSPARPAGSNPPNPANPNANAYKDAAGPTPKTTPGEGFRSGRKPREFVEEIRVSGQNLVGEVERLLREGEVRRLRIKQNERILLDLPVTWAAVGALLAPPLAAVAAIAAAVGECTIEVIRAEDTRPPMARTAPGSKVPPANAPKPSSRPAEPYSPDDLSYK